MKRRAFITLLAGATAWPIAARAQQSTKLPTIGFLGANNATFERASTDAFVQRLRELGSIENRTIAIEYRWAEGRDERFAEIAAEFVQLEVDIIVTGGNAAVAAKQASSVIPIVFALVDDPVGSGLVASLARPGGNVTGLSIQSTDLAGRRLALLREVVPSLRRLAIMANVDYPAAVLEMGQVQTAAGTPGLDVAAFEIRRGSCVRAQEESVVHVGGGGDAQGRNPTEGLEARAAQSAQGTGCMEVAPSWRAESKGIRRSHWTEAPCRKRSDLQIGLGQH
jgi:ABC transporter substrate binding protein